MIIAHRHCDAWRANTGASVKADTCNDSPTGGGRPKIAIAIGSSTSSLVSFALMPPEYFRAAILTGNDSC